jgi:choline-sulfatase
MSSELSQDPSASRDPTRPPLVDSLIAGAAIGALAAAAIGVLDGLWSWRRFAQFTPGALERLRVVAYLACSYALVGALVGVVIAGLAAYYLRVSRLGTLLAHAQREHARARARDPRDALIGLSLVLGFVPIATGMVVVAFPRVVHSLAGRKNFALVVAVAMLAIVAILALSLALAIAVARPIEIGLRAVARGRVGAALSTVPALLVGLGLALALGVVVVVVRSYHTVALLHVRPAIVVIGAAVLAFPLARPGRQLVTGWARWSTRRRRIALILAPVLLFAVTALLGNRRAIIQSVVSYSGTGDPITAALKRIADRDRDGHSPWFGGDDCDDGDAEVFPGASDIPDDGIDQNCINGDAHARHSADDVGFTPVPSSIPADTNIVLITIDTLRADHLSCYGYPRATTPALDQVATTGTRFAAAWAHAPSTRYSMPAILTGRLPLDVYYDTQVAGWPGILPRATTIAEIMHDAGFATGAFTNYWYFDRARHMDQGFDVYDNDNARLHQGADPAHTRGSSSKEQTDKAIGFVAGHSGQRFFLWVHYYDPHHDYEAHPEVPSFGTGEMDRYDQEIRFTDLHIGRLFDDLKARGLWDKTVIVITGDHGEGFGEHGVFQHGYDLYRAQTNVPLIIRVPGLPPRVSTTTVGHVDILPTLANLVGAAAGSDMMGRSLLATLAGAADDPTRLVPQQVSYENNTEKRGGATATCHVLYNVSPHTSWEIYDLSRDPSELHDLSAAPGRCQPARDAFAAWYDNAQIPVGAGDALLAAPPTIPAPIDIDFGTEIRLLAVDAPAQVRVGDTVDVTWTFAARGRLRGGWKVFAHFENTNGGRFTGDHAPPRPFDWWRRGQFIRYTTTVAIRPGTQPGDYGLWMGVYRADKRRPVHAPPAFPVVQDRVRVLTLRVTP